MRAVSPKPGSWRALFISTPLLGVWKARCERLEGYAIRDSGHFIPEEQPGVLVDAILKFVEA